MDLQNYTFPFETTDVDKKPDIVISQKLSLKSYATRVFQDSTIGIVSSIVTTHRKYRRFFKTFILSLCVSGFIYQCITYLNHVLEYPEVMDFTVDRSDSYNMPAYTFCNNNAIRRSVFCRLYPHGCIKPSKEFCKKYSSYCGDNATLIPMKEYYGVEKLMSYEDILKYGNHLNEFLTNESVYLYMRNYEKPSGPYLRYNQGTTRTMLCYSVHSVVENNQQPLKKIRERHFMKIPDDEFTFYVDETEMMNPRSHPGILFSVHSPLVAVNPFDNGIFLKGGRTYKLNVEMQEEILLKEPFETNCVDYEDLWLKNNHTGPRTQEMCRAKCSMNYFLAVDKCVHYSALYRSNQRICDGKTPTNNTPGVFKEQIKEEKCFEKCRDDCRLSKYTTDISVRYQIDHVEHEHINRFILVEIYLSNDEVKVIRHSPKYVTVEVFSSIGGFIGCWLGIALMDILDVFGSIITVCGYAFKKRVL